MRLEISSLGNTMGMPQEIWLDGVQTQGPWGMDSGCPLVKFILVRGTGCAESLSTLQDYIFYLEPERLESGKGKCPYDPKLDTASALISECLHPTLVLWCQYVAFATRRRGGYQHS